MIETIIQKAALVGQVIEDSTYEALSPDRFVAQFVDVKKSPQYKDNGYFVFSDLRPGDYTLRVSGERFRPQEYSVAIPLAPAFFGSPPLFEPYPIIDPPGENELVVIAKTVNGGSKSITFDEAILPKEIRKGAPVLASGFFTQLAEGLDAGKRTLAKLDRVDGLAPGSIVRLVRDKSIRLKFDPYYLFPLEVTSIIGKVVRQDAPELPFPGAEVRLTAVNGINVDLNDIEGAKIATVGTGVAKVVLGAEKEVVTLTNHKNDYNLYFRPGQLVGTATLSASFPGYQTQTKTILITEKIRNRVDFNLIRL